MNKFSFSLLFFSCVVSTAYSNTPTTSKLLAGMLELGTQTANGFVPDNDALQNVSLFELSYIINHCEKLIDSIRTNENPEVINTSIDSTQQEIREIIDRPDHRYESNFLNRLKSPERTHISRIRSLEGTINGMTRVIGKQTIKAIKIFNITAVLLLFSVCIFSKYLEFKATSNQHLHA